MGIPESNAYELYGHLVCASCKLKLVEEMKKVKRTSIFTPIRMAHKFRKLLCKECLRKILIEIRSKKRWKRKN